LPARDGLLQSRTNADKRRDAMTMHLQYLRYILRHKWYVFQECCKLGIVWRGIWHDLSKFRPDEWLPYARYFYGTYRKQADLTVYEKTYYWDVRTQESVSDEFDGAWLRHIHRNPHHWQWHILREDDGGVKVLEMPWDDMLEMVADWRGAGKAQGKGDNTEAWYGENKGKMKLHPRTRQVVEELIGVAPTPTKAGG
jgi:hypothetical protein